MDELPESPGVAGCGGTGGVGVTLEAIGITVRDDSLRGDWR